MEYRTIPTTLGRAKLEQAALLQVPLELTLVEFGDGNGAEYLPTGQETALKRKVYEAAPNMLADAAESETWVELHAVLPFDVGGWWLREFIVRDAAGDAIFIGNLPESFKPIGSTGAIKDIAFELVFDILSPDSVTLKVDPSKVLATRKFVEDYVAQELAKLDAKQSVRVATTAAIALSGLLSVDGVQLVAGDRVLVKNQANGAQNGIYVAAAGAWARANDADASLEVTPGMLVPVEQGTVNADSVWQLVTDAPINLGVTVLAFEVAAGPTGLAVGTYRSITVDKRGRVIGGSNPVLPIAEGGTGAVTAAAALAALGGAPLAAAIPNPSAIDSATDFDAITAPGWFGALLGGAAGARNANHPDGQAAIAAGGGVSNYYWLLVARYSNNLIQVALPYVSSTDTAVVSIKFRVMGANNWSPWRSLAHSENLKEATQTEAEAGAITGKWMGPLRVLQLIRAAAAGATEALRGVLRVGTQAEVNAGTLDDVAVTPKKLRFGFSMTVGPIGSLAFPTWLGGLVIKWGYVNLATLTGTVTFPEAFPNEAWNLQMLGNSYNNTGAYEIWGARSLTQTGFLYDLNQIGYHWYLALGR
jgi:hypothetical protein